MNREEIDRICDKAREAGEAPNLRYANLRYVNLRNVDLTGANLRYADLRCADLRCADLTGANLLYADLRCANLRGANLTGANLRGANLLDADLWGGMVITTPSGDGHLVPTPDGWRVTIGCWRNKTLEDLTGLIADRAPWPEAKAVEWERRRPILAGVLALATAHAEYHQDKISALQERWGDR